MPARQVYQVSLVDAKDALPDNFWAFWKAKVLDAQWLAVIISPVFTFCTAYVKDYRRGIIYSYIRTII